MVSQRTYSTLTYLPFNSIPGPTSLPIVGTLWNYLPYIGEYSFERLHRNGFLNYKKYGPIIREEFVSGVNTIWLSDPDDFKAMFQAEGKCPMRRSHLALQKFRNDRNHIYSNGGLLPTNGSEWYRMRSVIQTKLSKPQEVKKHIKPVNDILDEFVNYLETLHQRNEELECFLPSISRLFLEIIVKVVFNAQLNAFSKDQLRPNSLTEKLMIAAFSTNSQILKLDHGLPLWKYYDTSRYQKLKEAQLYLEEQAYSMIKGNKGNMIEELMESDLLQFKDILGFACDMLLAGIDTTSYSMCFVLYHLSKHPEIQDILYGELVRITRDGSITADVLEKAKFAKCILKESLRLNPISIGVGRILAEDAVFSGYHVPKGTVCVSLNQIACRLPKYFKNPNSFIPERWDRNSGAYQTHNPYLSLPFGHGPRSCIARRLAEQNMLICIIKMVLKFKMEWKGKEYLDTKSYLINRPDGNVQIKLELRH